MEETRVPEENHQPAASHWQTSSYKVVSSTSHYEFQPIRNQSELHMVIMLFVKSGWNEEILNRGPSIDASC